MYCPQKTQGFTLLEILVVLGIMTLLLAVVPPALNNVIDGTKLKGATRDLAAGLRLARSQAIAKQNDTTLLLHVEDKVFQIANKQKRLNLPEDTKLTLTTAQSEQVTEKEGAIRFFADGSSTGGRITLNNARNTYTIDVNWLTGKIRIHP
ncbi:MAG: GspH/FimT family pseudopilin [Gammaproteobacteria bacterium]